VPPFHVFVLDASNANMGGAKYGIRAALYTAVCARPGADVVVDSNACLHVTDDQASALKSRGSKRGSGRRGGGADYGCSSSYAFHCARCLLHPHSQRFLLHEGAAAFSSVRLLIIVPPRARPHRPPSC
jgi:hypothetical protein